MPVNRETRRSLLERLHARPRVLVGGAVVAAAAIAFVLWWFQPQALLFDRVVDEAFPMVEPSPAGATGDAEVSPDEPSPAEGGDVLGREDRQAGDTMPVERADAAAGPRPLWTGAFASRNRYTVTGDATVYELDGGRRTLRLEGFASTNGPDLLVYLTRADHADDDDTLEGDFVDLGDLRGNVGDQNYDIPEGVDLTAYDTVVIWCRRFSVSFGAADLVAFSELAAG
jgi:hypothetical protein